MKHSLKIYGTLGPACADREILTDMFRAGMTGIRLNLSHCRLTEREEWLSAFYDVCDSLSIIPDFLVDLQGSELRIGNLTAPFNLTAGQDICLDSASDDSVSDNSVSNNFTQTESSFKESASVESPDQMISIPCPSQIFPRLETGRLVRLDDGKIILRITEPGSTSAKATVLTGGTLTSGKSIAIDGITIQLPSLTTRDRETIRLLRKYRITGVMQPFVRSREDLITLRKELIAASMDYVNIYAKIETIEGADHLMELLPYCDEIVIARGDLGNSVPLPRLPIIQKQLAATCRMARKPFMVVTQMLATMENAPVPTRAEVSDVANAILDGASSIMLTGETAAGAYPAEAMRIFCQTAYEAQRYLMTGQRMF